MGGSWYAVVDGKEGAKYDSVGDASFVFTPDSRHLAYVACVDRMFSKYCCVVVDGVEGKHYPAIGEGSPLYSPDGKHLAFIARVGKKWCVVLDGKEGKGYDEIKARSLVFSPDSRHLAYIAGIPAKNVEQVDEKFRDKTGDRSFVVLDEKEGRQYSGIVSGSPVFSPDGNHLAYVGRSGRYFLVEDEVEKAAYEISSTVKPVYNPVS